LAEIIEYIKLRSEDAIYCDCTVGGGGHLLAMLKATKTAKFIGIDWDPEAIAYAQEIIMPYEERCVLFEDNFVNLGLILDQLDICGIDGLLFDLGVSYHQLTTPARGFSFEREGSLLMRMSSQVPSLFEKIRRATKEEIIKVLYEYGDVRHGRRVGIAIFENKKSLSTTLDLRRLIEEITPKRFLKKNLHKIFQALRIWTNDELANIRMGISGALSKLNNGGRILVISYHSGEDRIVKNIFRDAQHKGELKIINKKVLSPLADEVKENPRARSAKLRVGEKCAAF